MILKITKAIWHKVGESPERDLPKEDVNVILNTYEVVHLEKGRWKGNDDGIFWDVSPRDEWIEVSDIICDQTCSASNYIKLRKNFSELNQSLEKEIMKRFPPGTEIKFYFENDISTGEDYNMAQVISDSITHVEAEDIFLDIRKTARDEFGDLLTETKIYINDEWY